MAVIAIGLLEPANIAVLFEMRKPEPNGEVIAKLMRRFIYTAGITGVMQIATLVIMTRLSRGEEAAADRGDRRRRHGADRRRRDHARSPGSRTPRRCRC